MKNELTPELSKALEQNQGFIQGQSFVLMSIDVYRNTLGIGSDEDLAQSVAAIQEGIADIPVGRTKPLQEVFDRLDKKYGIHS